MAPDPCWLPSAIMQTTAALVGIYAVVYVLTAQSSGSTAPTFIKFKKSFVINVAFLTIVIFGILTVYLNSLWLDSLSTHIVYQSTPEWLNNYAWSFFKITLFLITIYTIQMILFYRKG